MTMHISTTITTSDHDEFKDVRTAYKVINNLMQMFEKTNPAAAEMLDNVLHILSDIHYVD